ncbi:hypothetical protein AGDE_12454 [Angomonas deanei]|nr:hypothetical protein AGDE_12454 [Angomonas deanei]|eukprot:EPY24225.1 hypothetical protein AGDE_12454 [Angomonas deanei]
MLSNSRGYGRKQLRDRREQVSKLSTICPMLRKTNKCPSFNKEEAIRRRFAVEKEKEVRKKAEEMVKVHKELLADAEEGEEQDLVKESLGSIAHVTDQQRLISHFMDEIKKEPAYQQWNLEAEVAAELVRLGLRHCPYSHTAQVQASIKRGRMEKEAEQKRIVKLEDGTVVTQPQRKYPIENLIALWTAERRKVFANFTVWQKVILCLLWQKECHLPRKVVQDVRKLVTDIAEQAFLTSRRTVTYKDLTLQFPLFATEDDLETYLSSEAYENTIHEEEERIVPVVLSKPHLGVVNLSALPQIILYINQNRKRQLLRDETLLYFMEPSADGKTPVLGCHLTEKEMDVSQTQRAEELVTAVEWYFYALAKERKFNPSYDDPIYSEINGEKKKHYNARFTSSFSILRSFVMQNAKITQAEPLVTSLYKHQMHEHLLALDLSHNNLSSMRFIFLLRAHFSERLLRLSLKNNIITRKPEYQEQVRLSLPKLTSLDGESIRRPPLRFPKPLAVSSSHYAVYGGGDEKTCAPNQLTEKEYRNVMDTLARVFYIFETGYLPHTALQKARLTEDPNLPQEEELADEDNFPHRYYDPLCTFSVSLTPGVSFFNPTTMRLDREVELEETYMGMRLSMEDLREVKVFDVSMKNSSRNLVLGRTTMRRMTRGPQDCYLAYRCSLYPERMEVQHHLEGAVVSLLKIPGNSKKTKGKTGKSSSLFTTTRLDSTQYVVTIHGVMTWRVPSMRQSECLSGNYERTITFVKKQIPLQNAEWEKLHSPPLVIVSDVVLVRPTAALPLVAPTTRATRLVVQFGLEVCVDGPLLVQAVMERCTSEAAEEAALDVLVFGPPLDAPKRVEEAGDEEEVPPHVQQANKEVRKLLKTNSTEGADSSSVNFHIFSALEGRSSAEEAQHISGWGAELHTVSAELLASVVGIMNTNYTLNF